MVALLQSSNTVHYRIMLQDSSFRFREAWTGASKTLSATINNPSVAGVRRASYSHPAFTHSLPPATSWITRAARVGSRISGVRRYHTGRTVFDLSVGGPPPACLEGPGPLLKKQKHKKMRAAGERPPEKTKKMGKRMKKLGKRVTVSQRQFTFTLPHVTRVST